MDAPYPGGGGEVLGHMSNGYNSLTFLFSLFHVFWVFNIVANRWLTQMFIPKIKMFAVLLAVVGGRGGGSM